MANENISQYFIGTHEIQECQPGESEGNLNHYQLDCKKDHSGFIPVNDFTIEHLPSGSRDPDIYDLIKALSDLTVRITIKYTSTERPQYLPGTETPYPCYSARGRRLIRTGTGRVWSLNRCVEEDNGACPCVVCEGSDQPSKVWWEVLVVTATHVIYDDSEAIKATCRLWFDDDKSPDVTLQGRIVGQDSNMAGDWCRLICATHDPDLAQKLQDMKTRYLALCDKVYTKFENTADKHRLTFIVSHPHGCSKQVSVGQWVHKQMLNPLTSRYTYTTATCPGSSGALVNRVGMRWTLHPHSGAHPKCNYSGVDFDYCF